MRRLTVVFPVLPPSDNHIREPKVITTSGRGWRGGRRKMTVIGYTTEAEGYKKDFMHWVDEHYFQEVQEFVLGHFPAAVYDLEIQLYFPLEELLNKGWLKKWTSDSRPQTKSPHKKGDRHAKSPYKRLDTLNRRKLVEDALSEAISIDDSLTWEAHVVKLIDQVDNPRVVLTLQETDPRCYGVPEAFLED